MTIVIKEMMMNKKIISLNSEMMNNEMENEMEIEMMDNFKPKRVEELISVNSTNIINRKELSDIKAQFFKSEYFHILKNEKGSSLLDKEKKT